MFYEVLSDSLKDLLTRRLQTAVQVRERFYLAGGTALALRLGHRKSDDLDFFSEHGFDNERLIQDIFTLGGRIDAETQGTLHTSISGSRVSFFHYPYPLIAEKWAIGEIAAASMADIACMKIIAIAQRAEKKDFYDMYELVKRFSPSTLKQLLIRKYGERRVNCYHVVKSFFYFEQADKSLDPVSLNNTTWLQVKEFFLEKETQIVEGLCKGVGEG